MAQPRIKSEAEHEKEAAREARTHRALRSVKAFEPGKERAARYWRNFKRLLISPLTQIFMTAGIIPAQSFATFRKIPLLRSLIRFFFMRRIGFESRSAQQVFVEDFGGRVTFPPTLFAKTPLGNVRRWWQQRRSTHAYNPTVDEKGNLVLKGHYRWGLPGIALRLYHYFNYNPHVKKREDLANLTIDQSWTPYTSDWGLSQYLETYTFAHNEFEITPIDQRSYRVICGNNTANCSRFFHEAADLTLRHKGEKTIISNHVGVESSSGSLMTKDDLKKEVFAHLRKIHSIEEKLRQREEKRQEYSETKADAQQKPKIKVNFTGFSKGAAGAAETIIEEAVKEFEREFGVEVSLYADRTFSTMPLVVAANFKSNAAGGWISRVLTWIHWNTNPAGAYNELPPERRAATNVDPAAGENPDPTIPVSASLAASTESECFTDKASKKRTKAEKLEILLSWREHSKEAATLSVEEAAKTAVSDQGLLNLVTSPDWVGSNAIEERALREIRKVYKKAGEAKDDKKEVTVGMISLLEMGVDDRTRGTTIEPKAQASARSKGKATALRAKEKQEANPHNATMDQLKLHLPDRVARMAAAHLGKSSWSWTGREVSALERYSIFRECTMSMPERLKGDELEQSVSPLRMASQV